MAGPAPKASGDGPKKARIEIIPLIDVIFFLLATFVLFTLSLDKIVSMPVQLPAATNAPPSSTKDETTVFLQVSDEGTYYWKKGVSGHPELISVSEIAPRLQSYRGSESAPRVLIRGDNKAKFGAAVFALDEVRKANIEQVSIETLVSQTGR
jgi:biopolymer transport protein ExbD